jgi:hypothetical protein
MYVYELSQGVGDAVVETIKAKFDFKPCKDLEDKTMSRYFSTTEKNQLSKFADLFMVCPDITMPQELYTISNDF